MSTTNLETEALGAVGLDWRISEELVARLNKIIRMAGNRYHCLGYDSIFGAIIWSIGATPVTWWEVCRGLKYAPERAAEVEAFEADVLAWQAANPKART